MREPVVPLAVRGRNGLTVEVEATVDTGFTSFLTLPRALIEEMALSHLMSQKIRLADGSITSTDVFSANVDWHGELRMIEVQSADTTPLLGAALLNGSLLTVEYSPDGIVQIEAID
jgi:clan AA aspartic protease